VVLCFCGILIFLFFTLPFMWLVVTSIRPEKEVIAVPPQWVPHRLDLGAYSAFLHPETVQVTEQAARQFFPSMLNSLLVALGVIALNRAFGFPAAHILARENSGLRGFFLFFYVSPRVAPAVILMIPFFIWLHRFGLHDSRIGLIIAYGSFTLP